MLEGHRDIDEAFLAWEPNRQKASQYGFASVRDALRDKTAVEVFGTTATRAKEMQDACSSALKELHMMPSLEALEVNIRRRRREADTLMADALREGNEAVRESLAFMHATDLLDNCYNILHAGFAAGRGIPMKTVAEFVKLISSMDAAAERKEHAV
jgi:hypothetical protein